MIVQTGPNPEILYQINRILTENDIKSKDTAEMRNDTDDEPLNDGTEKEIDNESEDECDDEDYDCIVEQEVEKYKAKPISFLSLPDEKFEQKVIQKSKPVIYGAGFYKCPCGTTIKNKRHIKDHEKTNKHQLYILRNAEKW
jgi:hypothetical protein